MSAEPIQLPDPERVALAVDAMCVGAARPILIHVEDDPASEENATPFALFCTPLVELDTIADTLAVLGAVTVPDGWRLAGLCAPTTIRVPTLIDGGTRRLDAWVIHVVAESGAGASRLCVPEAHDLSGPTTMIDATHPLHRCLHRLVRAPRTP
ncbi:MAG TPA: hypothetical protein VFN21_07750 [Acidimicrobiales bacterium]|nr:hypothetical protein [Acidimicrobiales bacterium]